MLYAGKKQSKNKKRNFSSKFLTGRNQVISEYQKMERNDSSRPGGKKSKNNLKMMLRNAGDIRTSFSKTHTTASFTKSQKNL